MKIDPQVKSDLQKYLTDKINGKKKEIVLVTPYVLDKNEVDKILERFPYLKNMNLTNLVDKSLIAGLVLKFDSKVIDLSLKHQLNKFKKIMYETN